MSSRISQIELDRNQFLSMLKSNSSIIIFKFTASWCGPCKSITPYIENLCNNLDKNIKIYEVDIDESFDLFAYLRSKKMVKGVPCLLSYNKDNHSFAPNHCISGTDKKEIDAFFMLQALNIFKK